MPNWCYNDIRFYSDKSEVAKLKYYHHFLSKWLFNNSIFPYARHNWYGNALYGAGIIIDDNQKIDFPCRGFAECISDVEEDGDKWVFFSLTTETAWCPMNQVWFELLKSLKLEDKIKLAVFSEECGNEIYEIYDPNEIFFSEDIYVDGYGSEEIDALKEYTNKEDILPALQKFLNTKENDFSKLCGLVEEFSEKKYNDGEDVYLAIHEINRISKPY